MTGRLRQGHRRSKRGWQPANLQRRPHQTDGRRRDLFDSSRNGVRNMPAYRFQVAEHDRWAIVAYVRALQRSDQRDVADVPADLKAELRLA